MESSHSVFAITFEATTILRLFQFINSKVGECRGRAFVRPNGATYRSCSVLASSFLVWFRSAFGSRSGRVGAGHRHHQKRTRTSRADGSKLESPAAPHVPLRPASSIYWCRDCGGAQATNSTCSQG
ncbi:hypothetical protein MUK42_36903 [Musa troglodytarum]|uniref:Uncharacterized protein n=1 Tax=Musa troglodytarum TaxID=320322 RepID=A0A9E7JCF8_9LILI|nr:hypothetical protein MUK42_36903 [Musa troglodytarum]